MTKFALAFALAVSALSTPASAADRGPDIRVEYADLRLSDAAGRKALDQRISAAVEAVCGLDALKFTLAQKRAARRCVRAKQAEVAPQRAAALASRGVPVLVASAQR